MKFVGVLGVIAALVSGIAAWLFFTSSDDDETPDAETQYTKYSTDPVHLRVTKLKRPVTQLADPTLADILQVIYRNYYQLRVSYPNIAGATPVVGPVHFVKGTQMLANFHMFGLAFSAIDGVPVDHSKVQLELKDMKSLASVNFNLSECMIKHWKGVDYEADLVTIKVPRRLMQAHQDITKYFISEADLTLKLLGNTVCCKPGQTGLTAEVCNSGSFECFTFPAMKDTIMHTRKKPNAAQDPYGTFVSTDTIEYNRPSLS